MPELTQTALSINSSCAPLSTFIPTTHALFLSLNS